MLIFSHLLSVWDDLRQISIADNHVLSIIQAKATRYLAAFDWC